MKFYDLIEYKTATIMYKAKHEFCQRISNFFEIEKYPNYNTRQVGQLSVIRHKQVSNVYVYQYGELICGIHFEVCVCVWRTVKIKFIFKQETKR